MIEVSGNYQFFHANLKVDKLLPTVQKLLNDHKLNLKYANLILLSDDEVLTINRDALKHDYYTDIITFDYSKSQFHVETELYISYDRIKENAATFKTTNKMELLRVILHGFLHLAGFKDKTESEQAQMRLHEEKYINHYTSLENG